MGARGAADGGVGIASGGASLPAQAALEAARLGARGAVRTARPLVSRLVGDRAADQLERRPEVAVGALALLPLIGALGVVLLFALVVGSTPRCAAGEQPAEASGKLNAKGIPSRFVPIYEEAAAKHRLGARGPSMLASIHRIETGFGRLNKVTSTAGAQGHMQFMPGTWRTYGTDGNGNGRISQYEAEDAIHSAARYLRASGAPGDWRKAIFAYNHAGWYVERVLAGARHFGDPGAGGDGDLGAGASAPGGDGGGCSCATGAQSSSTLGDVRRVSGGGRIVAIPGFRGERIDSRLLADIAYLRREYRIKVTDGYAASGHASNGEHPLGLAIDVVPGKGGSWEDIDRLARFAEPKPGRPRAPFRWVGYDGDSNHGRGNHLHLSWDHGPVRPGAIASSVSVFASGGAQEADSPGAGGCAPAEDGGGGDRLAKLKAEAERLSRLKLRYVYGGGHQTPAPRNGPFDCSSSVSRILQAAGYDIRTMDSGDFMRFGRPGRGEHVTIYANAGHVLVVIDGRAWGTSGSRSGRGPGWISRSFASPSYLSRFTARHPRGL